MFLKSLLSNWICNIICLWNFFNRIFLQSRPRHLSFEANGLGAVKLGLQYFCFFDVLVI